MKKYKLTKKTKIVNGKKLYQIEALKDFGNVKKGDKGGWIEKESNLSQNGDCWVYDNAMVYDSARVSSNAKVFDNASVYGNAWVSDSAWVFDDAKVFDDASVYGNARVYGDATVYGNTLVYKSEIEPTITNEIEEIEEIVNEIKQILLKNDNDPTKIISDNIIDEIAYDLRDIREGLEGVNEAFKGLDY